MSRGEFVFDLEKLLAPIPGESPVGASLRHDDIYDEIRKARKDVEAKILAAVAAANRERREGRKTDDLAKDAAVDEKLRDQIKAESAFDVAGPSLTEMLATIRQATATALQNRSKDLQLAVWFLEATARLDGFAGAARGLQVVRGLLERFWDTCFPIIDAEDEEPLVARVAVLEWINENLPLILKTTALNEDGEEWSLAVYQQAKLRPTSEKELKEFRPEYSIEKFDESMKASSLEHFEALAAGLAACREELNLLEKATDERVVIKRPTRGGGERIERPVTFKAIVDVVEACRPLIDAVLQPKRAEAGHQSAQSGEQAPAVDGRPTDTTLAAEGSPAATPRRRVAAGAIASRDDALERLQGIGAYLATENPADPLPYLLSRAVAFAPVWGCSSVAEAQPLASPTTNVRTELRTFASEGQNDELLKAAEAFQRTAAHQMWLDLQRYVVTALEQLGHTAAAKAVRLHVKALLQVVPDLVDAEFADGTPVANQETRQWLRDAEVIDAPGPVAIMRERTAAAPTPEGPASAPPLRSALLDQAKELARTRRLPEALAKLQLHVADAASGRERFLRRLDLAEVCLEAGNPDLAFPVLDELANIIERAKLEDWEDRSLVVRAWSALVRCCRSMDNHAEAEARGKEIFTRLCRLDISTALDLDKLSGSSASRWHRR